VIIFKMGLRVLDAYLYPFRSVLDMAARMNFNSLKGTTLITFFLSPKLARSFCGLCIGSRLYFCIQGSGLPFKTCLLCLAVSCLTIKLHWAVSVHLASCTACRDVSFFWNGLSNYINHNHRLKPN